MRKTKFAIVPIAAAVGTLFALEASAFEFHGYLRSGLGSTLSKDGNQACFQLPGAFTKYRLGNECETYAEMAFDETAFKGKDGAEFAYHAMLAYKTTQARDYESLNDTGNDIAVRQFWVEAKNIPFLRGAGVWAGKRFYRRNDVHITDFFYWDASGPGVGIENVSLGPVKLHYAIFRNTNRADRTQTVVLSPITTPPGQTTIVTAQKVTDDTVAATRHDLRISDIPFFGGGNLEIGLQYNSADVDTSRDRAPGTSGGELCDQDRNSRCDEDGWAVTLQHFQGGLWGGFNKLALQYFQGSAASGAHAYPNNALGSSRKIYRVVEQIQIQPVPQFSGMGTIVYHQDKDNYTWWSAGIRPVFHVNDYFKVQAEIGYDQVKPKNPEPGDGTRRLTKFTIAPTIVAGGTFWSRPEIRLFYTHARWNDKARDFWGGVAGGTGGRFGSDTSGDTIGAQVEAWF